MVKYRVWNVADWWNDGWYLGIVLFGETRITWYFSFEAVQIIVHIKMLVRVMHS